MMRAKERAAESVVHQSKMPARALGAAASTLGSFASVGLGSALLSRAIPFLNRSIPTELAVKGLSKIDPRLGKFFTGIFGSGYTVDEGLDYLRNEINPEEKQEVQQEQTEQPQAPQSGSLKELLASGQVLKAGEQKQQQDQGLGFEQAFAGAGKGISENFYKGIFEALKQGKDTFSGVKDPLLLNAKPAFQAGQIKSVEDLKNFAKYMQQQQGQQPQAQQQKPKNPIDEKLLASFEKLLRM
jgi:hypothetical protein